MSICIKSHAKTKGMPSILRSVAFLVLVYAFLPSLFIHGVCVEAGQALSIKH